MSWGRYWVFAHNGDLKDFRPRLHSHFRPVGDTDSEHAFCWIMQELAKSHASVPSIPELTLTLKELAARISPHGTFNFCSPTDKHCGRMPPQVSITSSAVTRLVKHISATKISSSIFPRNEREGRGISGGDEPADEERGVEGVWEGELVVFSEGRRLDHVGRSKATGSVTGAMEPRAVQN